MYQKRNLHGPDRKLTEAKVKSQKITSISREELVCSACQAEMIYLRSWMGKNEKI